MNRHLRKKKKIARTSRTSGFLEADCKVCVLVRTSAFTVVEAVCASSSFQLLFRNKMRTNTWLLMHMAGSLQPWEEHWLHQRLKGWFFSDEATPNGNCPWCLKITTKIPFTDSYLRPPHLWALKLHLTPSELLGFVAGTSSGIKQRPNKVPFWCKGCWTPASIPAQTAGSDDTPACLPACLHGKPGLDSGGSTTANILLQIKLMVLTAEIASQMN